MKRFLSLLVIMTLILSTVSLFTGCSPVSSDVAAQIPPNPSKTFTALQIREMMVRLDINTGNFILPDGKYVLAKKNWLETEFSSGLAAFQFQFGINNWSSESNDCDKFTAATSFYAKWLNHSSPNRNVNASLACGEVYYRKDVGGGQPGGYHAINVFIVEDGDSIRPAFYEPQTRRFVLLKKSEMSSIFFWKM